MTVPPTTLSMNLTEAAVARSSGGGAVGSPSLRVTRTLGRVSFLFSVRSANGHLRPARRGRAVPQRRGDRRRPGDGGHARALGGREADRLDAVPDLQNHVARAGLER